MPLVASVKELTALEVQILYVIAENKIGDEREILDVLAKLVWKIDKHMTESGQL